ncbi:MAG: hypothetical protein ACP5IX_03030 [Patescibacteria group bacterium]
MPELEGAILIENAEGRKFDEGLKLILIHEEQHAIESLFTETKPEDNIFELIEASTDQKRIEEIKKI